MLIKTIKKVGLNIHYLKKVIINAVSIAYGIITAILAFVSLEDLFNGTISIGLKIFFIFLPLIVCIIISIVKTIRLNRVKFIEDNNCSIYVQYGDLWENAFSNEDNIVVVNVNTAFDTIVDGPGITDPLVDPTTVHGQWINRMLSKGITIDKLDYEIKKSLDEQGIIPILKTNKTRGKNNVYEKGTIAKYKYENTTFYLLAFSDFDEHNHARNSKEEISSILIKLFEYISENSQGRKVYMPIMGSKKSRTNITDQIALDILLANLKLYKNDMFGEINVVVYKGLIDKVAIA